MPPRCAIRELWLPLLWMTGAKSTYAVLDLNDGEKEKSPLDINYWPDNPSPLPFGKEIVQVGYGIIDPEMMPTVKKGTSQAVAPEKLRPEEIDPFLSTTARFTADAQFQVLSDNQYIYLFRQSIDAAHEDNIPARNKNKDITDSTGATVYLVDDTLLLDRFVLTGKELHPKMEVRYKRSRNKYRPQSNKDSLGAQDMNKKPFREPTQELGFVENLRDGRFSVLLLPTQVVGMQRWQIFTHNNDTGLIDSFNVERADDGLFNTQGSQFYTSPDPQYQKSVYEREPGIDPFTGKPLIPVVSKTGFGEYALEFDGSNDCYIDCGTDLVLDRGITVEAWIKPQSGTGHVVNRGGSWSESGYSLFLFKNKIRTELQKPGAHFIFDGPASILDRWQHVAFTWDDRSKTIILYLNGNPSSSPKQFTGPLEMPSQSLAIGKNERRGYGFHGEIDEVRIWNRALSEAEINANLHYRLEGNEPGLEAYWRFDEDTGNTVRDLTGNGHDGTLSGSYRWVSSDAPIGERSGIRRSSFAFDGRTVESGLSALLYYQQQKAATGYDAEAKPLKRQARVMLAAATGGPDPEAKGKDTGEHYIAVLDFAVSREGKLAQVPDRLDLGTALSAGNQKDLERLSELEKEIENLRRVQQQELSQPPRDPKPAYYGYGFGWSMACTEECLMVALKNDDHSDRLGYEDLLPSFCFFHLERDSSTQELQWVSKEIKNCSISKESLYSNFCQFGNVAMDGEYAIGSFHTLLGSQHVRTRLASYIEVFHLENNTWVQQNPLDVSTESTFQPGVDIDGEWIVVAHSGSASDEPLIQFFRLESGTWVNHQGFTGEQLDSSYRCNDSLTNGDGFNPTFSSIDGEWCFVTNASSASYQSIYTVHVLHLENGTWRYTQKITDTRYKSGSSVAVSGEWAFATTFKYESGYRLFSAVVLIYHLENNVWQQKQEFFFPGKVYGELHNPIVRLTGEYAALSLPPFVYYM